MWKNIVEPDRPQMTILRMRIACWIPKATNIHTPGICNIYWSSTTTVVKRTYFKVKLYVHTSPALTCITLPCLDLLLHSLRPDHLVSYSDFEHHGFPPPLQVHACFHCHLSLPVTIITMPFEYM